MDLVWTAPPGCPLREQVIAKARELVEAQGSRSVSTEGTIHARPEGFELVLRAEVAGAERSRN